MNTAWYVEYAQVPLGGKAAPRPRTDDDRTGRHDRLVVEDLQVGPGTGHHLQGGNYAASGRSLLGRYPHPGETGQVSGRVSYHQAKDIKIAVEVPAIAHLEGTPNPTERQRTAMEAAVRDAAVASVHRQWDDHQGEDRAIEAQAAADAKAALPEGISGFVKVSISVGGPATRHFALPSVDYHLDGPSDCYVSVQVPTRGFAYHARSESAGSRSDRGGDAHRSSTDTDVGVAVGGTVTAAKGRNTATDAKIKASVERRTKILSDYEHAVASSFTRDFSQVWRDIATRWESTSGTSTETETEHDFTVHTHGPEAEERLKKQSEEEKDPSLWERAKSAVKGFVTGKLKGWISDGAEKILGKNIVFRLAPGAVRKWVAKEIVDLGWKVGDWLWDKITGKAKSTQKPEKDVTPKGAPQDQLEQYRDVVRTRLQNYALTTTEFKEQAGSITTHFSQTVTDAVHRSFETEFGSSASVDVHTSTDAHDSSTSSVGGSAGASVKTHQDDASGKGHTESSSEAHVYETDGVRTEGGEPEIKLLVRRAG